jgi:hypothetical protein
MSIHNRKQIRSKTMKVETQGGGKLNPRTPIGKTNYCCENITAFTYTRSEQMAGSNYARMTALAVCITTCLMVRYFQLLHDGTTLPMDFTSTLKEVCKTDHIEEPKLVSTLVSQVQSRLSHCKLTKNGHQCGRPRPLQGDGHAFT